MSPQLIVLGRGGAEAYRPVPGKFSVCISVTDPGSRAATLSPEFEDVLRLKFHDLEPSEVPADALIDPADGGGVVQFMTPLQAEAIIDFAAKYSVADYFVIHCEAGVSRSRSIAEALFDAFGRRAPNQHVYQQVQTAFRKLFVALPQSRRWIDFRWNPIRRGPR